MLRILIFSIRKNNKFSIVVVLRPPDTRIRLALCTPSWYFFVLYYIFIYVWLWLVVKHDNTFYTRFISEFLLFVLIWKITFCFTLLSWSWVTSWVITTNWNLLRNTVAMNVMKGTPSSFCCSPDVLSTRKNIKTLWNLEALCSLTI